MPRDPACSWIDLGSGGDRARAALPRAARRDDPGPARQRPPHAGRQRPGRRGPGRADLHRADQESDEVFELFETR